LVEAMAQVVRTHPSARLLIAGGSKAASRDDVDALIEKFGLRKHARNLGQIGRLDVIDLLAAADVCAVPKLDDPVNHAGLSTKLAEYLAAGKPVVVSRVGDVAHYLSHMENAVLCHPGDADDLAAAIRLLLSDPDLAHRIGAAGRSLAEREFDVGVNVRRLLDAIGTITS
jgi:glycosyltransferase involved in cell wall biosynthesis